MAIFVPHQSNVTARNANPVQTAQYQSPSAYMTGRENLGQGLQQLAGGAEKLNDVLFNGTVEERMERLELSAKIYCQNRKLEVANTSEELQTQFTGKDAQGLTEKLHELQTSKLQEMHDMFGHNPKILKYVVGQCGDIYNNSITNMRAYEKQQQKVYRTGVTHAEIGLASQVWMDPDSTQEQREKALSSAATMVLYNAKVDGLPEEYAKQQNDALRRNFTSERLKMEIDAKLEAGDIEGARATLLNVENGNVDVMETAAAFAAQFESGSEGITAIGHDRNGGTSYGKHQITSKTMGAFITYLDEKAPHIAAQLKEAGPVNTGGTTGKMPDTWKKIAAEEPELFEKLQYDFIVKTHVTPTANKLPAQLQRLFASDPAIASAIFSTAVQHGASNKPASAPNLIKQAWENSGGNRRAFITNLYAARATCFQSSTEETQKKAAARFERERDMLLAKLQPALLSPSDRMALEKRIDLVERQSHAEHRMHLEERVRDVALAFQNGEKVSPQRIPTLDDFKRAYGAEDGVQRFRVLAKEYQLGESLQLLRTMTPQQQEDMYATLGQEPGAEGYANALRQQGIYKEAMMKDAAMRRSDPATYAMRDDTPLQDLYKAAMEERTVESAAAYATALKAKYEALGMEGEVLLPGSALGSLAQILITAEPFQAATEIQSMKQQWDGYWPQVFNQLVQQGGLPGAVYVIGAGMDPAPATLLMESMKDPKFLEHAKGMLGSSYNDIKDHVPLALEPLLATIRLQGGGKEAADLIDSCTRLACQYALKGFEPEKAAKKAYEEIGGKRYHVQDGYRIPAKYDPALIKRGIREYQRHIEKTPGILLPDNMEKRYTPDEVATLTMRATLHSPMWITENNEAGLVLHRNLHPVQKADGSYLQLTWEELEEWGRKSKSGGRSMWFSEQGQGEGI